MSSLRYAVPGLLAPFPVSHLVVGLLLILAPERFAASGTRKILGMEA